MGAQSLLRPEKKRSRRLSGGCAIVITTGKKVLVICLAGARSLLRPEIKKDTVVCLAGYAVVSVFGSDGKKVLAQVVVFVCVVFCVLCCLQNNPVFSSVTYLNIKK